MARNFGRRARRVSRPRQILYLAVAATLAVPVLMLLWYYGWVLWYTWQPVQQTAIMRQELARLQSSNPNQQLRHTWVAYDSISNHLKRAVISSEDSRFLQHRGVDWQAIAAAREHNRLVAEQRQAAIAAGRAPPRQVMRGGSTISQQLAKNLLLSHERSYVRKGQELIITWMIEYTMDKRRILELYLNSAEWGEGVFGAEAAAQHYFGVSASRLTATQAARLAAKLPRPRFYDGNRSTRFLERQSQIILRRMSGTEIP